MTLENSSLELINRLKTLHEAVSDLFRFVTEDCPYEHALADRFEHSTGEILGRLDAALNAATILQKIAEQYDHGQAFSALVTCHAEFNIASDKLYDEPKSFDWLQDLHALGTEHPDEWKGWVASIRSTLNQCVTSSVYDALLRCWQSLLVSSGAMSARHIKNIGWQVIPSQAEAGLDGPDY
jgi:hypothetical protein